MVCFHPDFIRSEYGKLIQVPCGKCYGCLKQKRQQIAFRIEQEVDRSKCSFFLTLTYEDEYLERFLRSPGGVLYSLPSVNPRTHELFIKRLRRYLPKISFYMSAEYGDKSKRPHYHYLIWSQHNISRYEIEKAVNKSWHYGLYDIGMVESASINYVAKHQVKRCLGLSTQYPNFHRSSHGIGKSWLTEKNLSYFFESPDNRVLLYNKQSHIIPMPRYIREKVEDYCLVKAYFPDMPHEQILTLNNTKILELTENLMPVNQSYLDLYFKLKNMAENDEIRSNKEFHAYRVAFNRWQHSPHSIGKTEEDFISFYYRRLNKEFIDSFKYYETMYNKLSNLKI